MKINDGGPAFPTPCSDNGTPVTVSYNNTGGMSLLDWFAGQLVAGVAASMRGRASERMERYGGEMEDNELREIAKQSYRIADAMMAFRAHTK